MQCNDIDGINASGRAPIIMQQASASAWRQRLRRWKWQCRRRRRLHTTQVSIGDNVDGPGQS